MAAGKLGGNKPRLLPATSWNVKREKRKQESRGNCRTIVDIINNADRTTGISKNNGIVCTIGGLGRYIGRLSTDYRSAVGRYIDRTMCQWAKWLFVEWKVTDQIVNLWLACVLIPHDTNTPKVKPSSLRNFKMWCIWLLKPLMKFLKALEWKPKAHISKLLLKMICNPGIASIHNNKCNSVKRHFFFRS